MPRKSTVTLESSVRKCSTRTLKFFAYEIAALHFTAGMAESIDWKRVQDLVRTGNTDSSLLILAEQLQSGNKQFAILQKGLRNEVFQQASEMFWVRLYA